MCHLQNLNLYQRCLRRVAKCTTLINIRKKCNFIAATAGNSLNVCLQGKERPCLSGWVVNISSASRGENKGTPARFWPKSTCPNPLGYFFKFNSNYCQKDPSFYGCATKQSRLCTTKGSLVPVQVPNLGLGSRDFLENQGNENPGEIASPPPSNL